MDLLSGAVADHLPSLSSAIDTSVTPLFKSDSLQDLFGGTTVHSTSSIIIVNSIVDVVDECDGVTTLREAIALANTDIGEDSIVFERSLFATEQTIGLSLGELNIIYSLNIIAPQDSLTGANLLTVSGNNASRVFEIGTEATVTIFGLIVADGRATDGAGGGINNSGTLTLDNSIVRNHTVTIESGNNNAYGGGIYNTGTLTLNNSTISGNKASYLAPFPFTGKTYGGGIYNTGTLTVSNSTLSNNTLSNSPGDGRSYINTDGGGIYNTGTLTVSNSTFSGNSIGFGNGGGIYNTGTLGVSYSTLSDNFIRAYGNGGGIYNTGNLKVSNSTLNSNRTGDYSDGGGIYNTGTLEVSNSTVNSNIARGSGGGILNSGTLYVSNSTISNNSASRESTSGGGISNSGTLYVSNSTISGNFASALAGGIYNSLSGIVTLSNSTLSDNSAVIGGGIWNEGTLTVSNSTINRNVARTGRSNASGVGGGISNRGILRVSNSTVSDNSAFSGEPSDSKGGGIYNRGTLEVSNSTISGNKTPTGRSIPFGGFGSGIYNEGTLTLSNSTLSNNSAIAGGGIYNTATGTLTISNTTLSGNFVGQNSGRVFNSDTSALRFNGFGGGIYNNGILTLVFSTLTLNQAVNGGGVFINGRASTVVRNTIIAANLLSADGVNPDVAGNFTSLGYNLIGDGTGSTGLDAARDIVGDSDNPIDPRLNALLFNDDSTTTHALLPDSPAINTGDPIVLATDPIADQRGFPRVSGGRADIGAFELTFA